MEPYYFFVGLPLDVSVMVMATDTEDAFVQAHGLLDRWYEVLEKEPPVTWMLIEFREYHPWDYADWMTDLTEIADAVLMAVEAHTERRV